MHLRRAYRVGPDGGPNALLRRKLTGLRCSGSWECCSRRGMNCGGASSEVEGLFLTWREAIGGMLGRAVGPGEDFALPLLYFLFKSSAVWECVGWLSLDVAV